MLTAVSWRYGYMGDELYFVTAGHHLAWGYADQPPLVPLIALAMDTIAPGVVAVLRIPSTLATVALIVLAALTARELGGRRRAQLITAGTVAVSPLFLGGGHLLATSTLDPVFWTALTFLLVRWVRTRSDRLLLVAGIVTAVALEVKFLVVGFWLVAIVAVLIVGPRDMLRRPAFWLGGAVAVVATIPTLIWQAQNGWPQLEMSRVIAGEGAYTGGLLGFLPVGLLVGGLLIGSVLAIHGAVRLLRDPVHRLLGITALGVVVLFMVTGGRVYYFAGMLPLVWAASAVGIERHRPAIWWRWVPMWPTFALTVLALAWNNTLPIAPVSALADQPVQIGNFQLDEIGWPAMVDDVARAHRAAPRNTVVVTDSYWVVSAVQKYAPEVPAYSGSRGAAWFGAPPESSGDVVFVGDPSALGPAFGRVTRIGALDDDVRVNNLSQGTPIFLLEGRHASWAQLWPRITKL